MCEVIPIGICKLRDNNDDEVEKSVKIVETKRAKIQLQSNVLRNEVDCFHRDNVVLEKQINCSESLNQKLKIEISKLKSKTEDAACSLELTKWKLYKGYVLKEFENLTNKEVSKQKFKYEQFVHQNTKTNNLDDTALVNNLKNKNNDKNMKILREKAKELMQEVEIKKRAKEKVDSNLCMEIEILERRNAALTVRFQRQLQETESRYRQTLKELNCLQKLLAEKNKQFTNI